ncbi:glycyl-radical enzyme activating protein [Desulfosporosinus sp. SYSU MS00001]|uniref:glycyl-radical enzyme activating protein n=1 Tax=Desulfosporosinus sp. SYSU MS00001 TaxID=3416284 RepID=UPI003CEA898C
MTELDMTKMPSPRSLEDTVGAALGFVESPIGTLANTSEELMGSVLRIERTSIHDGQGLRTVIFLKGCPLRCRWCSTPESQRPVPERGYVSDRCNGCGKCVSLCPQEALVISKRERKVISDYSKCRECFTCAEKCPQNAIKKYGRLMLVSEIVREISKDEIFFFYSGGGVTISGGEPLDQSEFVSKVLKRCRELGIHTAMESSFYASFESILKVLPWLNLLYVDLKHMNKELHQQWVGADNSQILDNLRKVDASDASLDIIARIPLVPGVNDSDSNLLAVAEFCQSLRKLQEIELLPYHRLGLETYRSLQRDYSLPDVLPPAREKIIERAVFLAQQNPGVPIRVDGELIAGQTEC